MKGREDFKGNGFVEYAFSERSRLSLSAGIDNFERNFDPGLGNDLTRIDGEGNRGYVKLSYSLGDFKVQSVWDHLDMDFSSRQFPQDGFVVGDAFDLDIQHVMKLGDHNVLTGGAGYRFTRFDSPFLIGSEQKQNFFSAFLQDEYSPLENLTFTAGLQLYTHPEAGVHVSPRASVVYAPWENHTFRASVARAFRNPTILENFVDFDVLAPPCPPIRVKGDPDLKSEAMTSVEFGYQTFLFERLKARIDFFYNDLDDLVLGPSPVGPGPCPAELALSTGGGGTIIGGELAFEFLITDWLTGFANYSYQNRDPENTRLWGMGARNKGNVGVHLSLPKGFRADAFVNIVGQSTGFPGPVGPYTMVHLHLGYDFELPMVKGRLGFAGFNLFNDQHREVPGGDIIDRRLTGFVELRF
jgi:iron complex outermembrane receptor protein